MTEGVKEIKDMFVDRFKAENFRERESGKLSNQVCSIIVAHSKQRPYHDRGCRTSLPQF